jgi:hypothetical protein
MACKCPKIHIKQRSIRMKEKRRWKVFTYNGKEIFAYTIFGEGADEEEATIALLAYENHCYPEAIHVHEEMR